MQSDMVPITPGMPAAQPAGLPDPNAPLTVQVLSQYPPDQQRNIVGEKIYPLIAKLQPELAGKITGMLLDSFYTEGILSTPPPPPSIYLLSAEYVIYF